MKRIERSSDVVVAGGGVIGMSVAYHLAREGLSVTVLDYKKRGNASWASAGGLWPVGESVGLGCGVIFFRTLSKQKREAGEVHDADAATPHILPDCFFELSLESNRRFPALWEELAEVGDVDFKFERTGLLYLLFDDYDRGYSRKIEDAIPHLSDQVSWLDRDELRAAEPQVTPEALGALRFSEDHQVNPYLLVESFRRAAERRGARMIDGAEVTGVRMAGGKVQAVAVGDTLYPCGTLVNATGSWAAQLASLVGIEDFPVEPVKGQIVLSERAPKMLHACLSTSDCYVAQKDNGEILIGSTTERRGFDTTCSFDSLRDLGRGAVRAVPALRRMHVKRTWAGLRPGTPDELPILGPVDGVEGYLNACGHFRTGILTSPITGEILAALATGQEPPVAIEPFLLDRFAAEPRGAAVCAT